MKKSALLSKEKIATVVALLMVVLLSVTGCSIATQINEEQRLEKITQEEELKRDELSSKLEDIYFKYLEANDKEFVENFDIFLEEKFGEKERFLKCLERQKIYNEKRYEEYLYQVENFSKESQKRELKQQYLEDKNNIYEYLTEEEVEILEKYREEIEEFYKDTLD